MYPAMLKFISAVMAAAAFAGVLTLLSAATTRLERDAAPQSTPVTPPAPVLAAAAISPELVRLEVARDLAVIRSHVERLIGTLRRECLDRVLIFGEAHLRRILFAYAAYYNQARTHLALQKDAPLHRVVQRSGVIVAIPILAGLHHQYVRI